jgi:hypothetical protein
MCNNAHGNPATHSFPSGLNSAADQSSDASFPLAKTAASPG